jgi:autotransporter-associated beta strand protein
VVGLSSGTQLTLSTFGAFSGSITGAGGLKYNLGGGTVSAPANVTYTGGTTLGGGGTFQAASDANFGAAASGVQINNAILEALPTYPSTNRTITVGDSAATLLIDSGGTLTINTAIQATGSGALTKNGPGQLTFGSGATLPGGANFTATGGGVVDLGNQTHYLSGGTVTVGPGGSTIQNGTLNSSAGYVLNGNATITAALAGGGGVLATAGTSTLSNSANSYTGGTTINGAARVNFPAGTAPAGGIVLGGGVLSVDHLAGGSAALVAQVYNNTSGWGQQPYIAPYSTLQNTIATPSSAGLTIAGFALTSAGGNTGLLYIGNADGNNPDPGTWGRLGLGNLGAGNNNDNFDVVFSGYIKLSAGTYNFATNTDDGSMLYIGGQTVVSNNYYQGWGGQGNAQRTGSFTAPAAGYYSILPGRRRLQLRGDVPDPGQRHVGRRPQHHPQHEPVDDGILREPGQPHGPVDH